MPEENFLDVQEENEADDREVRSRYRPLVKPTFQPNIPMHLLAGLSDKERYMVEAISRMEQQNNWQIERIIETRNIHIETDVRIVGTERCLKRIERWRLRFSSKWTIFSACVVILLTALVGAAVSKYVH